MMTFFFDAGEEEEDEGAGAAGANHATSFLERVLKKKLNEGAEGSAREEQRAEEASQPHELVPPRPPVPLERPPPPPSAPPVQPASSSLSAPVVPQIAEPLSGAPQSTPAKSSSHPGAAAPRLEAAGTGSPGSK